MHNEKYHETIERNKEEIDLTKPEVPASGASGLTRRRFLRNAAVGAAGAAALSMKGVNSVLAQTSDAGEIVVDAIMLSYIGAPLGSTGSTSITFTKSNASTILLTNENATGLTLQSSVGTTGTFSVGSSTTYRQSNSTQVTNGITLRRSVAETTTTPAGGVIGNTTFIGLKDPRIRIEGTTSVARFKFLRAFDKFAVKYSDLQSGPVTMGFRPGTAASFLEQYVTDPSQLVTPRFKLKSSILLSAGVTNTFSMTKATGSAFSTSKTRTTSVEITQSTGFNLGFFQSSFSVGNSITVTHTSVQEFSTDRILTVTTTLNRTSPGINKIFWDRVFKTFLIIDAGLPASQPLVQGIVLDQTTGAPIPNAHVRLVSSSVEYSALTDNNGNYEIYAADGDSVPTGVYSVVSGEDSVNATIGSNVPPPTVTLSASPGAAQDYTFDGENINLN